MCMEEDYTWISRISKMGQGRFYVAVPKAVGESMHNADVEVSIRSIKRRGGVENGTQVEY